MFNVQRKEVLWGGRKLILEAGRIAAEVLDPHPASHNALRSALQAYYLAALEAVGDLADRDTLAVLARRGWGRGRA